MLRGEWGFDGFVVSDWGAVNYADKAVEAGMDLEMSWLPEVKAVLECYLAGDAVGKTQVDILFGKANPCGCLPETFPVQLLDMINNS